MPSSRQPLLPRVTRNGISRLDVLPAVVAGVIGLSLAVELIRMMAHSAEIGAIGGLAVTLAGLLIATKRPFVGLAVNSFGCLVVALGSWGPLVEWSITVFLVFIVTLRFGRPIRAAALVVAPTLAGTIIAGDLGDPVTSVFATLVSLAAGSAIGAGLRAQRLYRDSLERRAEDALATRELEATRRVAEERLRIARDLHDVVGHEVAVVSMNLGVVEMALVDTPSDVTEALDRARTGVRNVLAETQRMLVLLRSDDEQGGADPVPDLASLPTLFDSYRHIGMDLHAELEVPADSVDAATQLTVYRILQEALTNAQKHGRGAVSVTCAAEGVRLVVQVRNGQRLEPSEPSTGLGLVGMRERVAAGAGTMTVNSTDTEFVLTAHLPLKNGRVA
ncbi:sensor histidine kinase [Frondihabitans sp. VKM Ac-2883]|uniref:sensor histidine kinase n=1 Tax=Frondihabitans sp. VKM Ac-2883 TaxID=2783823 RepID=UPI00188B08BA|nr:histidine kinase [Frondihabitans sp. VKM Ac-2883]MBF4577695.1 two-component sensor histidine kinase [Frondihabitans sp. VKM Ac-2883]